MSTIRCDIVSAEQEIFHGEATLVVATGELGDWASHRATRR
jgi:F-type H+-transporting ATPase subunit epsilon